MRAYILLILILLTGCASKSPITSSHLSPESAWQEQSAQLEHIHNWQIRGKFSIKQGNSAQSANLTWLQPTPEHYDISLSGPLGQGGIQLSGNPTQVVLKDAKGKTYRARNAETLLYQHTGWSMPIESLYYWTRGLPDPHYPHQHALNDQGQLARLKQHGWDIQYVSYQGHNQYTVPRKIILTHQDARITLLLNKWQINQH